MSIGPSVPVTGIRPKQHRTWLVRAKGLEPPQAFAYQDLNLARLPFPPRPRNGPHRKQCRGWKRLVGRPGIEPGTY